MVEKPIKQSPFLGRGCEDWRDVPRGIKKEEESRESGAGTRREILRLDLATRNLILSWTLVCCTGGGRKRKTEGKGWDRRVSSFG